MGKDDLIKIKYEVYEPGESNPIDDLNIYYDSVKGVYKHNFVCECGENIGCFCFDSIENAIDSVETRMMCSDCYNQEMIEEYVLEYPDNAKMIDDLMGTKMHKNMLHNGGLDVCMDDGKKYDEVIKYIRTTISNFTSPELGKIVHHIGIECDCGDFSGYSCEV